MPAVPGWRLTSETCPIILCHQSRTCRCARSRERLSSPIAILVFMQVIARSLPSSPSVHSARASFRHILLHSSSRATAPRILPYSAPRNALRSITMTAATSQDTNGATPLPVLTRDITTGSTPSDFHPPPDKAEYHPYRLADGPAEDDWTSEVDLDTAAALVADQPAPPRFLILYGSLRTTSYSRLLAFEMARLLEVGLPLSGIISWRSLLRRSSRFTLHCLWTENGRRRPGL